MKKRKIKTLAVIASLFIGTLALHAETYDYGFVLSCGMDFTYHSPVQLTEHQRMEILHMLDEALCGDESGEVIDPLP